MSVIVTEKEAACNVMQQEFSVIKDFRKKRHDLIKELDQQRQLMTDTERRHSETVARMERKFFEEKIRLQKEANRKISELATKAHKEAVANLKETEKEVFRQNIRISEALQYHVQEGEEMAKTNAELVLVNRQLLDEKNLHDVIVKEKITQTKQQAREIKELKLKIQSMEHTLSHVVREFEHERDMMGRLAKRELDEVRKIASKLNEGLTRKSKETRHIKRLAQHILDQRTDLERFFMDALDHVRGEIHEEKEAARKAAQQEYNRRMKAILTSRGLPSSTSAAANTALPVPGTVSGLPQTSVVMPASTSPLPASSKVELSELSWEDKEKIMRLLFARMNGMSLVGKAGGEFAEAAAPTEDAGIRAESETGAEEIGANDFREDEAIQGREVDIGFDDDPEDETWSERNGFDQQALPVAVGWT
ncbi:hypothetical protein HKX48_003303 [Thoreauomyces humboldtii]|nr:hypothetical protein HKX48_003303 [Thoreauomyces humboldtii]